MNLKSNLNELFAKREKIKVSLSNTCVKNEENLIILKSKLKKIESDIAEVNAEENFNYIKDNVKHLVDNTENLNSIKMWQLKKKNAIGELVTEPSKLKELYANTYKKRLEHRIMKPELQNMYQLKMSLFSLRIEVSGNLKSAEWSEENLLKVLKSLKKNKSSDSHGLIYELFRPEVIGKDLFKSLLMLCNNMKSQLCIPEFVKYADITSIYKLKGEKSDIDNERGLFGVSKVRSIIEKLIYQDIYDIIDEGMSDSNVGGRRGRNIRDNLLVIYAAINEAIKTKKPMDIQLYDLAKCFDAMWAEESMNDFYDAGVKNDKFALVSLMNNECQVKVKTPVGDTERF